MRTWRTRARVACILLVLAAPSVAEESAASKVVGGLDAALLDVLKQAEALGYQGRFDRLAPTVAETFDIDLMAEKALGRYWNTLADTDRKRWVDLFREFMIANYASNLDKYSGQRFELVGEEPGASDTTIVRTKVVEPGQDDVELNYRLREVDTRWKIIDVYLKGTVSELALRRSDYTSVLDREGFETLVGNLRGKITDLAAGRGRRQAK